MRIIDAKMSTSTENGVLEYKASNVRLALAGFGSLAFVGVSLWLLTLHNYSTYTQVKLYAAVAVFTGTAAFSAYRLTKPPRWIRLDAQGLSSDAIPGLGEATVLWEDISGLGTYTTGRQKFIVIYLKNPDAFYANVAGKGKVAFLKMNAGIVGSPISFHPASFSVKHDVFASEIEKRLQAYGTP